MAPKKLTPAVKPRKTPGGQPDFQSVFAALKEILKPYEKQLRINTDKPACYAIEMRDIFHRGKPLYFAGVRLGKAYVSYYLMPVYMNPPLMKQISPDLKKRMQGKACFNFSAVDPALFRELAQLTSAGLKCFKSQKLLEMLLPE